eukprot:11210601-Lingulodinium_polyedra.AAC.1
MVSVVECGAVTRAQAANQQTSKLSHPPVEASFSHEMLIDQGSVPGSTGVQGGGQSLQSSLRE